MRSRDRPACQTDLLVQPDGTRCEERGHHRAIHTPGRPDYSFGNYLELDAPPEPNEVVLWFRRAAAEFVGRRVDRPLLVWETALDGAWSGARTLSQDHDYSLDVVFAHQEPPGGLLDVDGFELRPLRSYDDWRQATELTIEVYADEYGPGFPDFERWRMEGYRRSFERNTGDWWGAFSDDGLASSLGLFETPELLRFQSIQTADSHRKMGLAGALIRRSLRNAFARHPGALAVVVADEGSPAERLYRDLGFGATGLQHVLQERALREGSPEQG